MLFLIFRPIIVITTLLPYIISFLRDWHRWILWGPARQLPEQVLQVRARRLTTSISALGPTFIKLVQLLGMREDFVPKVYADEFKKLQDQVPPFSLKKVRQIIRQESGRTIEEVFEQFDPEPIAAASLGQVHCAQYKGVKVAVKIRRPNVEKIVAADLRILFFLLYVLNYFFESHFLRNLQVMVSEFAKMIKEEMDFRNEIKNSKRFRENLSFNPVIIIPEVFEELCSERVFVLKYYEGVRVDDIAGLRRLNISPKWLIKNLIEIYTHQVVVEGFLHADPHPGNILINTQHKIIIIDYGMTVSFDKRLRQDLLELAIAVVREDVHQIVACLFKLQMVEPDANMALLRDAADVLIRLKPSAGYEYRRIQQIVDEVLKTFYKFPLRLPHNLVFLFRAAALVEGIGISFDPQFDAIEEAKPIVLKMVKQIYLPPKKSLKDKIVDQLLDIWSNWQSIKRIIYRMEREEMKVRAHESDIMEMRAFLSTLMRRSLLGLASIGLAFISTLLYLKNNNLTVLFVGYFLALFIILLLITLPIKRRRK
ncbi:AarF/ABC1/UbiB kinase family protein [Candidatus Sumerlaeota bacterium]|nr:AarF/ABC1/UbiB kinase family protein [Candidatus Sumerlaeota bacterium]